MANYLNLPTAEQQSETNRLLQAIAFPDKKQTDYTNSPGFDYLTAGDKTNGFYGFVQPGEFGEIAGNPTANKKLSASNLALAIGLTQGTPINEETAWMKFAREGKVLFVPVKPLRHTTSWDAIYKAGAVYGDDTPGVLPLQGRAGKNLSVDATTNSFVLVPTVSGEGFLYSAAKVGNAGDTIVTKGFTNAENNKEFVITAITDTAITVSGGTLVTEAGVRTSALYNKVNAVTQNRKVTIGDKQYRVRLLKGASQDPLDSFNDADRDSVGPKNEWNALLLPLHEKAKLGNWAYSAYAGTVVDWGVGLTDADLSTHYTLGLGSYTWCQETSGAPSFRRVVRGYTGASGSSHGTAWYAGSNYGWRPCLELI